MNKKRWQGYYDRALVILIDGGYAQLDAEVAAKQVANQTMADEDAAFADAAVDAAKEAE